MSLYSLYLKERENIETIEIDKGFITYSITPDSVCIHNIFVLSEHRHEGIGHILESMVLGIARKNNINKIYGFVSPSTVNANYNLTIMLKDGYKLDSCTNNLIVLLKLI